MTLVRLSSLLDFLLAFFRGWYPHWQMVMRSTPSYVFGYVLLAVLAVVFTFWVPCRGPR